MVFAATNGGLEREWRERARSFARRSLPSLFSFLSFFFFFELGHASFSILRFVVCRIVPHRASSPTGFSLFSPVWFQGLSLILFMFSRLLLHIFELSFFLFAFRKCSSKNVRNIFFDLLDFWFLISISLQNWNYSLNYIEYKYYSVLY